MSRLSAQRRPGQSYELTSIELVMIRLVSVAFLTMLAALLTSTIDTGSLQIDKGRIKFSLAGDDLWVGYVALSAAAGLCVWLFFLNLANNRAYKQAGEALAFLLVISLVIAAAI